MVVFLQVHCATRAGPATLALLREMVRGACRHPGSPSVGRRLPAAQGAEPPVSKKHSEDIALGLYTGQICARVGRGIQMGNRPRVHQGGRRRGLTGACKATLSIIRHVPELARVGIGAELIDELLPIAEEGSCPLKDIAFPTWRPGLALRDLAPPILLETDYFEQLTNSSTARRARSRSRAQIHKMSESEKQTSHPLPAQCDAVMSAQASFVSVQMSRCVGRLGCLSSSCIPRCIAERVVTAVLPEHLTSTVGSQ